MSKKNRFRAYQQARSNKEASYSLDKENLARMVDDSYNNNLKDLGPFPATILQIQKRQVISAEGSGFAVVDVPDGQPANYYEAYVRPQWFYSEPEPWFCKGFMVTPGTDGGLTVTFNYPAMGVVQSHPYARSEPSANALAGVLNCGDIVMCTIEDGPDDGGHVRNITFKPVSDGLDAEFYAAAVKLGANPTHFFNKSATLLGQSTGTNVNPETLSWSGYHNGKPSTSKPSKRIYIGNARALFKGQTVYNGVLDEKFFSKVTVSLAVYTGTGASRTFTIGKPKEYLILADAAPSFKRMNEAFKKEFGHDLPYSSINRSWNRQVSTKGDGITKGKKAARPGQSKHGWGVAIDFLTGDRKYNKNGKKWFKSSTHLWLKENGYKYGWLNPDWARPPKSRNWAEPWHFEWMFRATALKGEKNPKAWYPIPQEYYDKVQ